MTNKDAETVFLYLREELEELGIFDELDEVEASAQKTADGLEESVIGE